MDTTTELRQRASVMSYFEAGCNSTDDRNELIEWAHQITRIMRKSHSMDDITMVILHKRTIMTKEELAIYDKLRDTTIDEHKMLYGLSETKPQEILENKFIWNQYSCLENWTSLLNKKGYNLFVTFYTYYLICINGLDSFLEHEEHSFEKETILGHGEVFTTPLRNIKNWRVLINRLSRQLTDVNAVRIAMVMEVFVPNELGVLQSLRERISGEAGNKLLRLCAAKGVSMSDVITAVTELGTSGVKFALQLEFDNHIEREYM